jgi:1-phosphofructokinase family hexose kinase
LNAQPITVLSPSPALDVTYLLEEVVVGGIHRPAGALRMPGGKGVNIARAARVLGETVRVVAPLGGRIGELLADLAAAEGIKLDVLRVDADTRLCISAIPVDGVPTEFYEPAPLLTQADAQRLLGRLGDGWSVLAGRLPETAGLGSALAELNSVAIDSSGADLSALIDEVRPALLKVNASEAAELLGRVGPAADLASALRERTGGTVVITDGAAGAVAVDAAGAWRAAPDPQPGQYAIGSGDSFFAGLLVALSSGGALPDALRSASAAGSANARVPRAAVFARAAYDAALDRIKVHEL